ncbi:hypothetical protein FB562_2198 [Homoserinimonas aerilata]|uniref:Head-tail joining protein n=1 Tax=Homoserinimonas aerilata TaxID=1162970 RepID=A0A542YFD9_9MICO|nr:hypothetical protein [Homoserinimonas aerilata]TQL46674.1 hypothetical protein FB562_2198 [Homoserinimonas aerilata]
MARKLRARDLPHRVDITRLTGEGAEGETWATTPDRPAYVEQKAKLVVDRRSTSPTAGQEVTASTFIVLLLEDDAQPRSKVTVWPGTPREREAEVITSAYLEHKKAPSHIEIWTE